MARKPEQRYIQYYADGNAVRVLEPKYEESKVVLPKQPKAPRQEIGLDFTAIGGMVMAVLLLTTMVIGLFQLRTARQERLAMESYVSSLQNQQVELNHEFSQIDMEQIELKAKSLGMIPKDQVYRLNMEVNSPAEVQEPGFLENVEAFLKGLFA